MNKLLKINFIVFISFNMLIFAFRKVLKGHILESLLSMMLLYSKEKHEFSFPVKTKLTR